MSTAGFSDLVADGEGLALRLPVLEMLFDEASDVAFFVKDRDGRYLSVNSSLAERHGFPNKEEMIGKRPSDVCPGPFGAVPSEQDAKILQTGQPLINHLEMQWQRPHKPCWCLTTKLPLRDRDEVVGLVGFSRDLRESVPLDEIPPGLALVLDRFEQDFAEPTSPSMLAREAGLSASQFARIMKRVFGVTPTQFISRTRINQAARLLRESDASVAEIALQAGFTDHSAFTRKFRSAMGATPTAYREALQDGE
jgi:PAS domain S-box-containing protein